MVLDATLADPHALVGRTYRLRDHYEVGREQVREFARAVQNDHPAHLHEEVAAVYGCTALPAPPTFAALLGGSVQAALGQLLTDCDLTSTVQTEQTFDFHRPILVGDRLTSHIGLLSRRKAFGGDLMVLGNEIVDAHGGAVLTATTGLVARADGGPDERFAAIGENILHQGLLDAEPPAIDEVAAVMPALPTPRPVTGGRALAGVAVGDRLPSRVYRLTLGDLVRYAGVAGDPNPIHWHPASAEAVGMGPGVLAHGMLTMSLGAGYLTAWTGDPTALRRYRVRLCNPVRVLPGAVGEIEFGGRVSEVDTEARTATLALTATHDGRRVFGGATATVALT
ncbi:fused (3R)-hydroxyacyl-ACP dehydratase subunits HadA/HadB [Nocardia sp. CC227C]|uniref:fused (3R)-hydroxyacyl-ACP dehydratase subunits HadA/HadB n=1 Tax=Nocardia sp. CC227C TaxID=3044562 RepID=UPI00278BD1A1|nr:fused (3R)-hydroxyacyl-ACP dehydratase subunits HadA/HadB [Nocardia sp. CC227C]